MEYLGNTSSDNAYDCRETTVHRIKKPTLPTGVLGGENKNKERLMKNGSENDNHLPI